MKKVIKREAETEIDWNAEFGEENEFTIETQEGEEVEILLKENRDKQKGKEKITLAGAEGRTDNATYALKSSDYSLSASLSSTSDAPQHPKGTATTIKKLESLKLTRDSKEMQASETFYPQESKASAVGVSAASTNPSSYFEPPMPRIDFDPQLNVVSPSPYNTFIELRTMSFTVKIICLVHLVSSPPTQKPHTCLCSQQRNNR